MADAVLVTGADGFIGRHLVESLRAQGVDVVSYGRREGDVGSCTLIGDGIGRVVHLAGRSFVPDSWVDPPSFYRANVLGTVNILELCRRHSIPLTYVSSYVYGMPRELPIDEHHPIVAFNPYSHSKILAEEAVAYFSRQFGVLAVIIRPFNVYGPGQSDRFLIPTLIRQALDPNRAAIVVADTRPRRDFLHVRDLVALLIATISRTTAGVFNAGSGRSVGIPELVGHINSMVPRPKAVVSTHDQRPDEIFDVVADISSARGEFRWEPHVDIVDGLRETVEWMRSQVAATR